MNENYLFSYETVEVDEFLLGGILHFKNCILKHHLSESFTKDTKCKYIDITKSLLMTICREEDGLVTLHCLYPGITELAYPPKTR